MNKSKKEVWCEHISLFYSAWFFNDYMTRYLKKVRALIYVKDHWKFCPICGAKRPGGKHGTK